MATTERMAMSNFADQMEQDRDWISWVPGGDEEKYHTAELIVGRLVDQASQEGNFGPVKIAILELEDGKRVGVWLNRTVLKNEFVDASPQWGERVGIKYLGEQLKKGGDPSKKTDHFQAYRVKVDRPLESRAPVAWGDTEAADAHGVAQPATPAEQHVPAPVPTPAAETPPGEDDIPF